MIFQLSIAGSTSIHEKNHHKVVLLIMNNITIFSNVQLLIWVGDPSFAEAHTSKSHTKCQQKYQNILENCKVQSATQQKCQWEQRPVKSDKTLISFYFKIFCFRSQKYLSTTLSLLKSKWVKNATNHKEIKKAKASGKKVNTKSIRTQFKTH